MTAERAKDAVDWTRELLPKMTPAQYVELERLYLAYEERQVGNAVRRFNETVAHDRFVDIPAIKRLLDNPDPIDPVQARREAARKAAADSAAKQAEVARWREANDEIGRILADFDDETLIGWRDQAIELLHLDLIGHGKAGLNEGARKFYATQNPRTCRSLRTVIVRDIVRAKTDGSVAA
jgi:hypothetical protein